jgi:asparagine synthase (glutamine-hydrolysing)
MCGIAGWLDIHGRRLPEPGVLTAMARALAHRGPDGEGFFSEPGIGLAHRRLAVIDLATGAQPMRDGGGRFVISFNGEIYNFAELRRELERHGHVFRTSSDTEVILEAWKEWGEESLARLEGMFAFALWDSEARTLFLARDRMGEKPLYYAMLPGGSLLFASEIGALLTHRLVERRIDPAAVEEFFALGYVAHPRTIYSTISKLPPASCLALRPGRAPALRTYWDVTQRPLPAGDAVAELAARLEESVARQMVADVPLGAFLSGGIDSGTTTALMARRSPRPVECFTIGFSDPRYDESLYAAMVARQVGGRHHIQTVRGTEEDLVGELAATFGEPFADVSAIPTLRLMRLARQHVTVALSGDGGDELFAGYRRYPFHLREEAWRHRLPQPLRALVFGVLAAVYPQLDWLPRPLRARQTFLELSRNTADGYFANVALGSDAGRQRLYSGALKQELQGYSAAEVIRRHFAAAPFDDPLAKAQYVDLKTWLTDDILTKVDRTAMACSLEVRVPMLDAGLVEFAMNLPQAMKLRGGEGKFALKQVAAGLLPQSFLSRPKQGFTVPLASWFRGDLGRQFEAELQRRDDAVPEFLDRAEIGRILREHRSGVRDHGRVLWSCWMFDRFLRDVHLAPARTEAAEPAGLARA